MRTPSKPSSMQVFFLVALRTIVGWHFLYEGVSKLMTPGWSAESYLAASRGVLAGAFQWILAHPDALRIVNLLNIYGLTIIGACLMLGLFSRLASVAGAGLICLYFLAYPPLPWMDFGPAREGSYLIVDKNLVEIGALLLLAAFPTGVYAGLDNLLPRLRRRKACPLEKAAPAAAAPTAAPPAPTPGLPPREEEEFTLPRRSVVRTMATLPVALAFGGAVMHKKHWQSAEEKVLADGISRATIKHFSFSSMKDLKGQVPTAKLGPMTLSRMMLGGNLIGGWAHSRDLLYVSKLVKAYHTRDKVFETFLLAERCGINTFMTNPVLCDIINEYWRRGIGKMQFISDSGGKDLLDGVKVSVDKGAAACYTHGGVADTCAKEGNLDPIAKALDLIRQNKLPAGIGAHRIETVQKCVEAGLIPDFWMKTLHKVDYWSAQNPTECDSMFCWEPQTTIDYMKERKEPWIAFKTMAAGAIDPQTGFRYAFENGADFICVGMYDFQIVDDVNLVLGILGGDLPRQRPWIA